MSSEIRRRRGLNYLGELGSKLRDLRGTSTLAHELIQNAEDAIKDIENPTGSQASLVFRISEQALIVDNGGVFSDCGEQDSSICPWKVAGNRPCDFHSFADVGGAAKRRASRDNSTGVLKGAFGFGFTAVYQITDHPQLISNGRHWILEDDKPEQERILECSSDDCEYCHQPDLPGTRFVLNWAYETTTPVRQGLNAPAVAAEKPKELVRELQNVLPQTVLFLDRLREIRVFWEEVQKLSVSVDDRSQAVISVEANGVFTKWALLSYDFAEEAVPLKEKHPEGEKSPSSVVKIAVPQNCDDNGLFFAYLPTQVSTDVPFHINADFFPTNDRKRLLMEDDYQGDWNRAAIRAGAKALSRGLLTLRSHLGPTGFWVLVQKVHDASCDDESLISGDYWSHIRSILKLCRVIPDYNGEWHKVADVQLLTEDEIILYSELHRELGVKSVHPDLLIHKPLMMSQSVGVSQLNSITLASLLRSRGLTGQKSRCELPIWFQEPSNWRLVWEQISEILRRESGLSRPNAANGVPHALSDCCIVDCLDGTFRTCQSTFQADSQTSSLFGGLTPNLHFASDDSVMLAAIGNLVPSFTISEAITVIEQILVTKSITKETALALIAWFNSRIPSLRSSPQHILSLKRLRICPTANGLQPFDQVVLPGGFNDPIGVTSVGDTESLRAFSPLIELLELRTLSLSEYVTDRLPAVFESRNLHANDCYALLQMLSKNQGDLYILVNSDEIRRTLRGLNIVPIEDGTVSSIEVGLYFPQNFIKDVLADSVSYIHGRVCSKSIATLLEWLGVETKPRLERVVEYMIATAKDSAASEKIRIDKVVSLFEHLAKRELELMEQTPLINRLRVTKWVPSRKMRWSSEDKKMVPTEDTAWATPNELFHNRARYLIETIAKFPAIPVRMQDAYRGLLEQLGVCVRPKAGQILNHLRTACQSGIPVDARIYESLNTALEEGEIKRSALSDLRSQECLFDNERQQYVRPKDCFSDEHPFGSYRVKLKSDDLQSLEHLLSAFEIRSCPSWTDAIEVIREISTSEDVCSNRRISSESRAILFACWRMIDVALHDEEVLADTVLQGLRGLSEMRVVCRSDYMLEKPNNVFFRDSELLAEAFSPSLKSELIRMPQGFTHALKIVGVRKLSEVTKIHVIHDEADRTVDVAVSSRIRERTELLVKIIEACRSTRRKLEIPKFESLRVFQSSKLTVELTFCGFNKPLPPVKHEVLAAFAESENTLWYCFEDGSIPWDSIACEISRMCLDDDDVAQLSAALNVVLEPDSIRKAQRKLSQLGFPSIELFDDEQILPDTSLNFGIGGSIVGITDTNSNQEMLNTDIPNNTHVQPIEIYNPTGIERSPLSNPAFVPSSIISNKDVSTVQPTSRHREDIESKGSTESVVHASNSQNHKQPETSEANRAEVGQLVLVNQEERFIDWLAAQPGANERRKKKISSASFDADRRRSELKQRIQRVDQVPREEVLLYLMSFYSRDDRHRCQMMAEGELDLHEMPFWKSNDQMYSGKEELFNRKLVQQLPYVLPETKELNLFLCPNCAAIYTKFVAVRPDEQLRLFEWVRSSATDSSFFIDCSLSGKQPKRVLVFHPKHLDDIRNIDGVSEQDFANELEA